MPNGEKGGFKYYDETYSGDGEKTVGLSLLSAGTGDLTDGVIPEVSWSESAEPYVGWLTVNPLIRFSFDRRARIDAIKLFFDDSEGDGGVDAPLQIVVSDGSRQVTRAVLDSPEPGPLEVELTGLGLSGDWVETRIIKNATWIMLSEVQFEGEYVPEPTAWLMAVPAVLAGIGVRRRRLNHTRESSSLP